MLQEPAAGAVKSMASSMSTSTASRPLRKSCNACVDSKVGCGREKPECSRCVKRGHPCSYSTARRPGRTPKVHGNPASHDAALSGSSTSSSSRASIASPTPQPVTPCGEVIDVIPQQTQAQILLPPSPPSSQHWDLPSRDIFGPLGNATDPGSTLAGPLDCTTDLDGLFASVGGFSTEDFLDFGGPSDMFDVFGSTKAHDSDGTYSSSTGTLGGASSSNTNAGSLPGQDPFNLCNESSLSDVHMGGAAHQSSNDRTASTSTTTSSSNLSMEKSHNNSHHILSTNVSLQKASSCECSTQAITLYTRLMAPTPSPADLDTTMINNAGATEHIQTMLHCSCDLSDSYILIILSLAMFKVISLYTDAARAALSGANEWQGDNNDPLEFSTQRRAAVQSILCRLASVQVLIEQLTRRLDQICQDNNPIDEQCNISPMIIDGGGSGGGLLQRRSLSTELANVVAVDLRKRLCELSHSIVEILRRT